MTSPAPATTPSQSQTLLLYLDLTQTQGSVDGLFADNSSGNNSKVWKNQNGNVNSDHVLTVSMAQNVAIGLQVTVNLPTGYSFVDLFGPNQCMRVTAVFGRDHKNSGSSAIYDSPFTIGDQANGTVCTIFDLWFPAASLTPNPSTNRPSNPITLPFGTPRLSSSFPNGAKDQYAFIVAVTLSVQDANNNNLVFTAGHDPQMDIGA